MKHYRYDEWMQYVKNELDEQKREKLENHLYTCDQCLDDYLQAMSEHESSLPILSNESSFTDLVMAEVSKQKRVVTKKPAAKKAIYQKAIFHYLLAAAATILLMATGAFQSLAAYANVLQKPPIQERKPTVTDSVINKTFAWMDSLDKKEADKK